MDFSTYENFLKALSATSSNPEVDCAICSESLTPAEEGVPMTVGSDATCRLPCGHVFHNPCFLGCRKLGCGKQCPLCRLDVRPAFPKCWHCRESVIPDHEPVSRFPRLEVVMHLECSQKWTEEQQRIQVSEIEERQRQERRQLRRQRIRERRRQTNRIFYQWQEDQRMIIRQRIQQQRRILRQLRQRQQRRRTQLTDRRRRSARRSGSSSHSVSNEAIRPVSPSYNNSDEDEEIVIEDWMLPPISPSYTPYPDSDDIDSDQLNTPPPSPAVRP